MNDIKLILLCGSRMALPVMRELVFFNQLAAVIIPEHCSDFLMEVKMLLKDSDIRVLTVSKRDHCAIVIQTIEQFNIRLGLMVTYTYKLPPSVYNCPDLGFFNLHPGPLPSFRGPDPVFQQIKNRAVFAGATIHRVDADFDTGPIVLSERIRLASTDTYGILTGKIAELAARMTNVLMKMASYNVAIPTRPQDCTKANYYKKQSAEDVSIDWNRMDADTIIALCNACNPWNKGAISKLNGKIIRILEAKKIIEERGVPSSIQAGSIVAIESAGILVKAISDKFLLIEYIYIDEGFLHSSRLQEFGFAKGNVFS